MDTEMRDRLGKACYEACLTPLEREVMGAWEKQNEGSQELYCAMAEAVAREFVGMMLPYLQGMIVAVQNLMGEQ